MPERTRGTSTPPTRSRRGSEERFPTIEFAWAIFRRISATTWYRLQRIVEQTSTVCVVFTPRAMISPAQTRIALRSRFSLSALEREPAELLRELQLEISGTRRLEESEARFA